MWGSSLGKTIFPSLSIPWMSIVICLVLGFCEISLFHVNIPIAIFFVLTFPGNYVDEILPRLSNKNTNSRLETPEQFCSGLSSKTPRMLQVIAVSLNQEVEDDVLSLKRSCTSKAGPGASELDLTLNLLPENRLSWLS